MAGGPGMKLNLKATIGFIIAVILISIGAFVGWHPEPARIELDSCGYFIVQDKMIEIHTPCKVAVKVSQIPKVEEEMGRVVMYIPKGWKWRIVP